MAGRLLATHGRRSTRTWSGARAPASPGATHIPPRLFKEADHLNKQAKRIHELLADTNPFNARKNAAELDKLLRSFIPDYGRFSTKARLYEQTIKDLQADKSRLEGEKEELQGDLKAANDKVKSRKLDEAQLKADLYNLQRQMEKIPPEIVAMYTGKSANRERSIEI